jgi:Uma2 family endonuclease
LAVEVLSPSDTSTAIQGKMLDYLGAGASRVWIVDPAARTVTVYRADGSATVLRSQDLLSGEDVLEGFALPLEELFGNLG